MPMLAEPTLGDRGAFEAQLRERVHPQARCEDTAEGPRVVHLQGDSSVVVAPMPAPIPEPDVTSAAEWSQPFWDESPEIARRHGAHAIIAGLAAGEDPLAFHRTVGLVAAALCRVAPVLGVYVGSAGLIVPQVAWRRAMRESEPGFPPLAAMVRLFQIEPHRGRRVIATQGLRALGMLDVEYHGPTSAEEAFDTVFAFAYYVLTSDREVRAGQTFGFSVAQRMSIEVVRSSVFPEEKAIRLNAK